MTLKSITRTCCGSVFNGDEEVRNMSNIYQKVNVSYRSHISQLPTNNTYGNIYGNEEKMHRQK